jgi:hypothetical protein
MIRNHFLDSSNELLYVFGLVKEAPQELRGLAKVERTDVGAHI